jgi:hypothetical protein
MTRDEVQSFATSAIQLRRQLEANERAAFGMHKLSSCAGD